MNNVIALKFMVVLLFLVIVGLSVLLLFNNSSSNNPVSIYPDTDQSDTHIMRGEGEGGSLQGKGGSLQGENGMKVIWKIIDGKRMYSIDGGQTWSETPPAGVGD